MRLDKAILCVLCAVSVGVTVPQAYSGELALLVGSQGTGSILRFDGQTGASVNLFVPPGAGGLGSGCTDSPLGLLFGPDGNLYVASGGATDKVLRYDGQTGAFIDTFVADGSGGLDQPANLAFGPDGHLYVSSRATDAILRYDGQTGAFMDSFVAPGSGGLEEPYALLFGPDGHLYVCSSVLDDADILRFNGQTGAFMDIFALGATFGLFENVAMVFGPDGHLYVSSAHPGKIVRYDGQTGAGMDEFVSAGSGGLEDPTGIRFGPDGHLYVSEYIGDSVLRYDGQTGAPLPGPLGAPGTAEFLPRGIGGLDCPWDLVFATLPAPVCGPSSPPEPERFPAAGGPGSGTGAVNAKNRYLSILAGDVGSSQAIRVRFADLPAPFDVWNFATLGTDFFVGEPFRVCENAGNGADVTAPDDCGPTGGLARGWFWAAPLVCDQNAAHFRDWRGQCVAGTCVGGLLEGETCAADDECVEAVHLFHEGLVPSGVYDIQVVDGSCSLLDDGGYSSALSVTQGVWGNIAGPFDPELGLWTAAEVTGAVDIVIDVIAAIEKFSNRPGAPSKARADVEPAVPDFRINISDFVVLLDAFRGLPYPFAPSTADPCS